MKAALLKPDGTLSVATVPDPAPEDGEVLLRVRDCGICGSDLHVARTPDRLPPDTIMGHEFAGEIAALGKGVEGWRVGERVIAMPLMACGTCRACVSGDEMRCPDLRGIGLGQLPGAYAEYVRAHPASMFRIPDHVSFRAAALVEPLAVGLRGVRRARTQEGAACIIIGAGPIGLVTVIWARRLGARAIVVSEIADGRAGLALRFGADRVVNPNHTDPSTTLRELVARDPDVVYECVGLKGTLNTAFSLAGPRGEIIVLGVCTEPDEVFPLFGILKELEVRFVLGYSRAEFEQALQGLADGTINADPLITDVVGIDALPSAFASLYRPSQEAKVLLEFA